MTKKKEKEKEKRKNKKENTTSREQYYIDILKFKYNILKFSASSLGFRHSDTKSTAQHRWV